MIRLLLGCLFGLACFAQERTEFRSDVELVTIPFTVLDAQGVAVRDLLREEIRVTDNGVRRSVRNLWIDDSPLTLGIIIDASESQQDQLAKHRRTALELLDRILKPGDRAFVISVDEDIRLSADLSLSADGVRRQLAEDRGVLFGEPCPKRPSNMPGVGALAVCGSSALWDAVYEAARLKLRGATGNKALLVLSDGFDTGSMHSVSQAAGEARKAEAIVYAIQYPGGSGRRYVPDLYRLVSEAGGSLLHPPGDDLQPIALRLERDLRQRWVVGFQPDKLGSTQDRHDVEIEVMRPDLTVLARKTYFQTN